MGIKRDGGNISQGVKSEEEDVKVTLKARTADFSQELAAQGLHQHEAEPEEVP